MKTWTRKLKLLGACSEAVDWCQRYDSLNDAWQVCERGDWMLWLVGRLSGEPGSDARKKLVLTACQCARLSLKYVKEGELRPLKAIETAEKWARGEDGITLDDVQKAAAATYAANAAYAAYAAAYAAYAAAYAAYAARKSILKQCADIVRQSYPMSPELSK